MLSLHDILDALSAHKDELRNLFNIKEIGVFGSYAINQQTDSSDIDFIVEFEPNVVDMFDTKYRLSEYLKSLFAKEIDITRRTCLKPYVKDYILGMTKYAV